MNKFQIQSLKKHYSFNDVFFKVSRNLLAQKYNVSTRHWLSNNSKLFLLSPSIWDMDYYIQTEDITNIPEKVYLISAKENASCPKAKIYSYQKNENFIIFFAEVRKIPEDLYSLFGFDCFQLLIDLCSGDIHIGDKYKNFNKKKQVSFIGTTNHSPKIAGKVFLNAKKQTKIVNKDLQYGFLDLDKEMRFFEISKKIHNKNQTPLKTLLAKALAYTTPKHIRKILRFKDFQHILNFIYERSEEDFNTFIKYPTHKLSLSEIKKLNKMAFEIKNFHLFVPEGSDLIENLKLLASFYKHWKNHPRAIEYLFKKNISEKGHISFSITDLLSSFQINDNSSNSKITLLCPSISNLEKATNDISKRLKKNIFLKELNTEELVLSMGIKFKNCLSKNYFVPEISSGIIKIFFLKIEEKECLIRFSKNSFGKILLCEIKGVQNSNIEESSELYLAAKILEEFLICSLS